MSHAWFIDPITSHNKSGGLIVAALIFLLISAIVLVYRVFGRFSRVKLWGTDDTFVLLSFASSVGQVAAICTSVKYGYGQHIRSLSPTQLNQVQEALYAAQLLYISSTCFARTSVAFRIAQIINPHREVVIGYRLAAGSLILGVASALLVALRGNLSAPWAVMDGVAQLFYRWLGIELVGMIQEGLVLLLVGRSIFKTRATLAKRWMAFAAFACRFLVTTPIVSARLYFLSPPNSDLTFSMITASIFTQISMQLSVMVASSLLINPFLRPFDRERVQNFGAVELSGSSGADPTRDKRIATAEDDWRKLGLPPSSVSWMVDESESAGDAEEREKGEKKAEIEKETTMKLL